MSAESDGERETSSDAAIVVLLLSARARSSFIALNGYFCASEMLKEFVGSSRQMPTIRRDPRYGPDPGMNGDTMQPSRTT